MTSTLPPAARYPYRGPSATRTTTAPTPGPAPAADRGTGPTPGTRDASSEEGGAGTTATSRVVPRRPGRRTVLLALLVSGVGLVLQAQAYLLGWSGARPGSATVDPTPALVLFYVGHVLFAATWAVVLTRPWIDRATAVAGSLAYAFVLYASWLMSNPLMATRFDESLHVITLLRMVEGNGFFDPNTMLSVSPHYPGLELVAGGVHWLTGMPLMAAQVVTVVLARAVLVLALFLLVERLTGSHRAGALVVLLYGASSQFWFFNAQFSYQTLAIPLAVLGMLLIVRAGDAATAAASTAAPDGTPRGALRAAARPLAAATASLALLALTHHLTGWLTIVLLWAWASAHHVAGDRVRALTTTVAAGLGTVVAVGWSALVAPMLADYLLPLFEDAVTEVRGLLTGADTGRQLFADKAGYATPLWEQLVMLGSVLLWIGLLLPAAWSALRGRTMTRSWARLLPIGLALVYPLLLVARFSPTASDIGERGSSFVTMAMAGVVAAWLAGRHHRVSRLPRTVVAVGFSVLLVGGTILGSGPDWSRVPGPWMAAAEQRSVDADALAAARWLGRYAPEDSRYAADTTFNRLLPTFADVDASTGITGSLNTTNLFVADEVDAGVVDLLRRYEIDFVVAETRLADQLAASGSLFEGSADFGIDSVSLEQLTKWEGVPGIETVLSEGPVRIYDVRPLRGLPQEFTDREAEVAPGPFHLGGLLVLGQLLLVGAVLVVRRRLPGRLTRLDRGSELRLALVLPALAGVGAVATLVGFPAWGGSAVLAVAGSWFLLRLADLPRRTGDARSWGRADVLLAGAVALLVATATTLAVVGAWRGLVAPGPDLPPPVAEEVVAP